MSLCFLQYGRMRFVASLLLVLGLQGWGLQSLAQGDADKPNIVLILVDDLGFGDISVNGAEKIQTPNIDSIAADGANFSQFYASANICTPSRAGLLTGMYPVRTGLAHGVVTANDKRGLPKSLDTLATMLKRADYRSKMVGKWHLGNFPEYNPLDYGFDQFFGAPFSNDMKGFALYDGREKVQGPLDQSLLTSNYSKEAIDFIQDMAQEKAKSDVGAGSDAGKDENQPFFLFVSHNMPHIPLYASKAFQGRSKAGVYGDVVEELDWSVGEIIKTLKAHGFYDNTIIAFTSDNGPFFEGSVAGLKGGKGSTYEGAYRVPLVLSWPARLKGGKEIDAISMNIDLFPTFAEAAGLTIPEGDVDGKSLLAVVESNQAQHQFLYLFNNENVVSVRSQNWKYLTRSYYRRSIGDFSNFDVLPGFNRAYDLLFKMNDADGEQYSLAERHPEVLRKHKAELQRARKIFNAYRTRPEEKVFPERPAE
ncbi:sulfatase family protein [Pseudoteredinibacter isoporae]|uniref:Putative sulfatase n=1 Tax=Pseudoteredinibacter isoporae TaxID=570281 RepID=A0A7X0MY23_9GAMM|nr:sulfatase [Pseudoteredinibacter isoporae]MBB6522604.1 putative sulfatase [Pseudoteredinibacter isoporae]NHO88134.1 sulfatase-like hydrolase/transferase [Pseudoteredinibacter isoporae]NIB23535.1 sulfatase-like hydrolase/transferase [Pseudoteredinibacter isoporae]